VEDEQVVTGNIEGAHKVLNQMGILGKAKKFHAFTELGHINATASIRIHLNE
jgi:hypothetical protein